MADFEFTYFGARGRGEQIRILFEVTGTKYTDTRLDFPTFGAKKAAGDFPYGSIPVLRHGDFHLAQTHAIIPYVAECVGLWPKDIVKGAKCQEIVSGTDDFRMVVYKWMFAPEEAKPAMKDAMLAGIPTWMGHYEKILAANGSGFLVGDSITAADYVLWEALDFVSDTMGKVGGDFAGAIDANPLLKAFQAKIGADEPLAAYLARRP